MSAFKTAEDLYMDAKFAEAHPLFKKALAETPSNQMIFPYLATTSVIVGDFGMLDHYLSFHFKNYYITDILAIEKEFEEKEFWEHLSNEVSRHNIQLSNLSKLVLKYFEADYEDRLVLLNSFIPATPIEEYWKCAFFLNIYTYRDFKEIPLKLDRCLSINPKCPLPYYLKHFLQHDLDNTTSDLDKALEIKPDYFEALTEKARMCLADDYYESYEEAIKTCDRIMYFNPPKEILTYALWTKGYSLVQLEKYSEGIICYNQSLQIDGEQNIYLDRASAKNRMKDHSGALTDYLKYIELEDEEIHPMILTAVGTIYLNQKKYLEAIKYYTEAIDKDNNSSIAYLRRASAFQGLNQRMLAEGDIKAASQIKGSHRRHGNVSDDEL